MAVSLFDVLDKHKFNNQLQEIFKQAQVVRVVVNVASKEWKLHLRLQQQPTGEELIKLKSALAALTPGPVLLEIDYQPSKSAAFQPDVEFLKTELMHRFPAARGWISNARWQCEEGSLTLYLPDEVSLELLKGRECDLFLQNCIKTNYGLDYNIYFKVNQSAAH
ncbi:MAG: PolC-type DNA polymerase III, partial [Firmicutes bacterium]|nr:PolC-type DNA polymerase III [Bacillota bacterium]